MRFHAVFPRLVLFLCAVTCCNQYDWSSLVIHGAYYPFILRCFHIGSVRTAVIPPFHMPTGKAFSRESTPLCPSRCLRGKPEARRLAANRPGNRTEQKWHSVRHNMKRKRRGGVGLQSSVNSAPLMRFANWRHWRESAEPSADVGRPQISWFSSGCELSLSSVLPELT